MKKITLSLYTLIFVITFIGFISASPLGSSSSSSSSTGGGSSSSSSGGPYGPYSTILEDLLSDDVTNLTITLGENDSNIDIYLDTSGYEWDFIGGGLYASEILDIINLKLDFEEGASQPYFSSFHIDTGNEISDTFDILFRLGGIDMTCEEINQDISILNNLLGDYDWNIEDNAYFEKDSNDYILGYDKGWGNIPDEYLDDLQEQYLINIREEIEKGIYGLNPRDLIEGYIFPFVNISDTPIINHFLEDIDFDIEDINLDNLNYTVGIDNNIELKDGTYIVTVTVRNNVEPFETRTKNIYLVLKDFPESETCIPDWQRIEACNPDDSLSVTFFDANECGYEPPSSGLIPFACDYSDDGLIGGEEDIQTTLDLILARQSSIGSDYSFVQLKENDSPILEFDFNFSVGDFNLGKLLIEKQTNDSLFSYLLINGLDLTSQNKTKTIYLEKRLNGTGLCIKDAEITLVSEISETCAGANEFWITCPGTTGDYSCELSGSKYKISGLKHSGVKEQATYCGDSTCNGAESCSSCSSDCGVCPSPNTGSSGGGSSSGGSHPRSVVTTTPPIDTTSDTTNPDDNSQNIPSEGDDSSRAGITGAAIGGGLKGRIWLAVGFIAFIFIAFTVILIVRRKYYSSKIKI